MDNIWIIRSANYTIVFLLLGGAFTLRIAINGLSAVAGGGVVYLNQLISHLRYIDEQNEYYLFVTHRNREQVIDFKEPRFHVVEANIWSAGARIMYEQLVLPWLLRALKVDVLYAPADVAPLCIPCRLVVGTQHQFIYYPEVYSKFASLREILKHAVLRVLAGLALRRADSIICISNAMRDRILEWPGIGVRKIHVVYHGAGIVRNMNLTKGSPLEIQDDGPRVILSVSSLAPHKNFEVLLKAYSKLGSGLRSQFKLVIVGRKSEPYLSSLKELSRRLKICEDVAFTGEISIAELESIYKNAVLFVFPSLLEGFGLPPLEAMAHGTPVLASNAPAIPEVCGDAALFFDPYDCESLKEKMEALLTDSRLRSVLIERGYQRCTMFSWEEAARITLGILTGDVPKLL